MSDSKKKPGFVISTVDFDVYLARIPKRNEFLSQHVMNYLCSNCAGLMPQSGDMSEPLICAQCNTTHYFVGCPHCEFFIPLTERQFNDLKTNVIIQCSMCKVGLMSPPPTMISIEGTQTSSSKPWSDDKRESDFLSRAKQLVSSNELARFNTYHETTGIRLLGAERHITSISELKSIPFAIADADSPETSATERPIISMQKEQAIYLFDSISNLRSSLETLSHELAVFFSSSRREREISFERIEQCSSLIPSSLQNHITTFRRSNTYPYLHSSRNVTQHRRLTLSRSRSDFIFLSSEEAQQKRMEPESVIYYLPDDPESLPGQETYNQKKDLVLTLKATLRNVREFILEAYNLAGR